MSFWRLAYNDRFVSSLVQEVDGVEGDCSTPFSFSAEGSYLVFRFTEEEFTKVFTALRNGVDLTYGDQANQVLWYFLRNVECPVSICDLITECITNNPGTRQAIKDLVMTDPDINNYITNITNQGGITVEERNKNLLKPNACDYGYTFNQASKFVFLLDQLTTDLFQAIEVGTNALERASTFVSAIPVVGGLLPFDELLTLADNLAENVYEDYQGAYTQQMYDDLRCGLWCEFKETCGLSIDEALAFYQDLLGQALPSNPLDTLGAILQFLGAGDIPGNYTVYAMHTLIIAAMRSGQEMFGIDLAQLGIRIVAAGDEADNDYEIICDECIPSANVKLIAADGFPDNTVVWESTDGEFDTYLLKTVFTGNYAVMSAESVGLVGFYVHSAEQVTTDGYNPAPIGDRIQWANGFYNLSILPCNVGSSTIAIYGDGAPINAALRIVVSKQPCVNQTVWIRARTDGDWHLRPMEWTIVGQTPTGGMIFDITDLGTTGPVAIGFDTITEDGSALQSAYLVSATVGGVEAYYHYHEQTTTDGLGDGASGTVSHKKWSWSLLGGHGQTLRVTIEPEPY